MKDDIPKELARELLDYDEQTGVVRWKERARRHFVSDRSCRSWNSKHAGKVAGGRNANGYQQIALLDRRYVVHRLIYNWKAGATGGLPIDHINGDRSDNRWENLRLCTPSENSRNTKRPKNNKSGRIGIHKHGLADRWVAQIRVHGKTHHLGVFDDMGDAVRAREEAERRFNFHANHGRA